MYQYLKRCHQRHIEGRSLSLAQSPEALGELRRKLEGMGYPIVGLDGRSRPIGREIEHWQLAAQLTLPVGPKPLSFWTRQHLVLPANIVFIRQYRSEQGRLDP